jgi:hypothetical protein
MQNSGFSCELHRRDAAFSVRESRSVGCVHDVLVPTTAWTFARFRAGQLPQTRSAAARATTRSR